MNKQKLLRKKTSARNQQNETLLLNICADLAQVYTEQGEYGDAIREYTEIAQIHKKRKRILEYAVANRGIGEAYLALHQFDEALKYQRKYLKYVLELENKVEEQRAVATIGHLYLTKFMEKKDHDIDDHDLKNSRSYLEKSLAISKNLSGEIGKFELVDMMARAYYNLGIVEDYQQNHKKAIDLLRKSIELCKNNDIYEQLYRGYVQLAAVYDKQEKYSHAQEQSNLAIETAKKLKKPKLLFSALNGKAVILLKMQNIRAARGMFHKAYRMKIPNDAEKKEIEIQLRAAAEWTMNEKKLHNPKNSSPMVLKTIYEKMGDAACALKCYKLALNHYLKLLEYALECGAPDEELAIYYYSIAETYTDLGQYDKAIEYYEKELQLCKNSLTSSLNTLSRIADSKESANASVSEVKAIYNQAIEMCKQEENIHEEGRMLTRLIGYLRRVDKHGQAYQLGEKLEQLNFQPSDDELPKNEEMIGKDIKLNELSDCSDDSDVESTHGRGRPRSKTYKVTKNMKGESKLHTAAAAGNLNVVQNLLAQGHPVNVRDNCGWSPLHEASNLGHLEVVKVLVKRGADINDRNGVGCAGVTPLHDAAMNCHLHIMEYLLDAGANAIERSDTGDTALSYLIKRKQETEKVFSEEDQLLYDSIVERLTQALALSGQEDTSQFIEKTPIKNDPPKATISKRNARRTTCSDLFDSDPDIPKSVQNQSVEVNDYRETIDNLRSTNQTNKSPYKSRTPLNKRGAILTEQEVHVDDWLEDDLGRHKLKRRKTDSPSVYLRAESTRDLRRGSELYDSDSNPTPTEVNEYRDAMENLRSGNRNDNFQRRYSNKLPRTSSNQSPYESDDPVEIMDEDSYDEPSTHRQKTPVKSIQKRKYQYQTKLTNFGHARRTVDVDPSSSPTTRPVTMTPRSTTSSDTYYQVNIIDPTLSVDVRINERLYRVPILLSQINTNTFKWLAEEAANRYAKKEYVKPELELETKNGALLADDDPISVLFPMGTTQAEEVCAKIKKYTVAPIVDRYKEACQDLNININNKITNTLEGSTINLDVSYYGLKGVLLEPLCRALTHQMNLVELYLAGNYLSERCFNLLSISMNSLANLQKLNLSCTTMTSTCLQELCSNLTTSKVTDLNLSENFLDDLSLNVLANLTEIVKLKALDLSFNHFTEKIFERSPNAILRLDNVMNFAMSDNKLNNESLVRIISWLDPKKLEKLDVSRNSIRDDFFQQVFLLWDKQQTIALRQVTLSRCFLVDADVFNLLRIADSLESVDLSYNPGLTAITLKSLLAKEKVQSLNLFGCKNIFGYFTDMSKYISIPALKKNIKLQVDFEENQTECDYLEKMWRSWYGSRAVVEKFESLLKIDVQ